MYRTANLTLSAEVEPPENVGLVILVEVVTAAPPVLPPVWTIYWFPAGADDDKGVVFVGSSVLFGWIWWVF